MRSRPSWTWQARRLAGALALVASALQGAPQIEVLGGVFLEAEDYDGRPWYGDAGFAVRAEEPLGSSGAVLVGMYKPGAVSYSLAAPAAGEYQVWLRCAVPGDTTVKIGANAMGAADLREADRTQVTVPKLDIHALVVFR